MLFSTTDTIVAIATPPGPGGIGIVRISGPAAHSIARLLTRREAPYEVRRATLARLTGESGAIDKVVVTTFAGPHSYTGEDVAEINAHGSPVLLRSIVAEAMRAGARLANPGEFTLRAFLNGRIDLVQAEAVRDLVDAVTPLQARAAFDQLEGTLTGSIREIDERLFDLCTRLEASLDFPEEGYHFVAESRAGDEIAALGNRVSTLLSDAERGRLIRDGLHVVLAGRPNSGKSSLFNRLAGAGRAIVTDVPGTTRDLLTETVDVGGVPVTIVDTAGVRAVPGDAIEAEGIARAAAARSVAAAVLVVLDGSAPLTNEDRTLLTETAAVPRVVVANKSDLQPAWSASEVAACVVRISALTGDGLDLVRGHLIEVMGGSPSDREIPAVTNMRHIGLLDRARGTLARAEAAARDGAPEEFVLADLTEARGLLEEITGTRTAEDVLDRIFSSFCIGK
jgi:tRNA modification GTPase